MRTLDIAGVTAFDADRYTVRPIVPEIMLPEGTRLVEFHAQSGASDLQNFLDLPESEQELVAHAVPKRKADFGDSRWCAHEALTAFGTTADLREAEILRGERGMPVFPGGITGSLTHTDGYRAALLGESRRWRSLGIDAEPAESLPESIFTAIARPQEQWRVERMIRHYGAHYLDKVLFSAKEATYKAWFPLTHRFLDFDQADIDLRMDGTFTSYLLVRPVPVPFIQGRWTVHNGYVVTLAAVPVR